MTELFRVCHAGFGDKWVLKKEIYKCVHHAVSEEDNDALAHFGDLENSDEARKNQTRLGLKLVKFKGRELSGIRLLVDDSLANAAKHKYRFVEAKGPQSPPKDAPDASSGPVNVVNVQGTGSANENVTGEKKHSEKNSTSNKNVSCEQYPQTFTKVHRSRAPMTLPRTSLRRR